MTIEDTPLYHAATAAIRALAGGPPRNLVGRLRFEYDDRGGTLEPGDLEQLLRGVPDNCRFLNDLGTRVHEWDAADDDWTGGTDRSTPERRQQIGDILGLDAAEQRALLERRPLFAGGAVVISAPWDPWYDSRRAAERDFYWTHYRNYLREVKGWSQDNVDSLHIATTRVIERLTDPTRDERHQSKGLVVGYVQSGKTANFTGVTAKAIDAGYRLVVVMTGTLELLRAQTQRRVDMELIGKQNIVGDLDEDDRDDYCEDGDWDLFLDLGDDELDTEIIRLTNHAKDYQSQFKTLSIPRPTRGKPLYDPDNLFRTSARVAIVKKNAAVLRKLVRDIKANQNAFAEIPVLIIDDESDQASVNTVNPDKVRQAQAAGKEVKARKAINEQIALMLQLMPRAQYVGYTATPFANVFVDPSDEQDIFPRDFVIGLDRPNGYMGVEDFYDFDDPDDTTDDAGRISNKDAHVRLLKASDDPDDQERRDRELAEALDAFVLAGAVKLWRARNGNHRFRHHTMLVHESVRKAEHAELADRVQQLWRNAGFAHPAGKRRLREHYERDVVPVSAARVEDGVEPPPPWDELVPHVAAAIAKITESAGDPVIVVNSDTDIRANQQALDFDSNDVWRVLVGGTKLSRGFTVEGLTVTYFRRATNMSDSLTQMGRWFGFRQGYRDLVRLYIAEASKFGRSTVNLYEAFEGIALGEAAFREQLQRYAQWEDGRPLVAPSQIPPLVEQHLPWLKPTATNKMFNSVLIREVQQPFQPIGPAIGDDNHRANLDLWTPLLAQATTAVSLPRSDKGMFDAFVGVVDAEAFVDVVSRLRYEGRHYKTAVEPVIRHYRDLLADRSLTSMLLILPQAGNRHTHVDGVGQRAVVRRKRRRGSLFGEITDSKHRHVAADFAKGDAADILAPHRTANTGAALVYLMDDADIEGSTDSFAVGFSSYVPAEALANRSQAPTFSVRREDLGNHIAVDNDTSL